MKNEIFAVVLAGGSGTRFWPMSRRKVPKQFLNFHGSGSLLQATLKRIGKRVRGRNIYIVTNARHRRKVKEQSRAFQIPSANILCEPSGKNTAPAIAWAAFRIFRSNPDSVMAVFPSDHVISHEKDFLKTFDQAVKTAEGGHLVTLGIVPTRPETGYGYIKTKSGLKGFPAAFRVQKFTEKPSLKKAKQFLKAKNYYWNSGMFFFKTAVILSEFKRYLPSLYNGFTTSRNLNNTGPFWKKLPNVSIDYGILEKSQKGAMVSAKNIGWSDVGSWEALAEILEKDKKGNIVRGRHLALNCEQTMLLSSHRFIAAVGLKDIIVIDTPDAVLICHKKDSQKVKDVVGMIGKQAGWQHLV